MALDETEIALLRESYKAMTPRLEDASVFFYERLFAIAPELRPMFRDEIPNQGMRFMTAVGTILERLDAPGGASDTLARLGQGHAALGVEPGHFAPMRTALLETFRETLGPGFTERHAAAWGRAYDEIAAAMVRAGAPGTGER